jgi:hypothetical protein
MKRACGKHVDKRTLASILQPYQRQFHLPLEEQAARSIRSTSCVRLTQHKYMCSLYRRKAPGSQTPGPD